MSDGNADHPQSTTLLRDPELSRWLTGLLEVNVSSTSATRCRGGHAGRAWVVEAVTPTGPRKAVVKIPPVDGPVFRRDALAESALLACLEKNGAPVPAVLGSDDGSVLGATGFALQYVEGHGIADVPPAGAHDDPVLRCATPEELREVWDSFYDALARLHTVDPAALSVRLLGAGGLHEITDYWRAALLDAAPADAVPRQLEAIEWLVDNVPSGGNDRPAVCMGDARLANAIVDGTKVRALVDFEVAYLGNPAADVGYSLLMNDLHRAAVERPLAFPSAEDTWRRWEAGIGRAEPARAYWTAFGATVLCVTVTRALAGWGMEASDLESVNPVVSTWESLIGEAS